MTHAFAGLIVLCGFFLVWGVLLLIKRQQVNKPADQDW